MLGKDCAIIEALVPLVSEAALSADGPQWGEACRKALIMKPGDRFVRDDGHAPGRGFRQLRGQQRSGLYCQSVPDMNLVGAFAEFDRHRDGHGGASERSFTRRASKAANIRLITASCGPSSDSIMMSAWA